MHRTYGLRTNSAFCSLHKIPKHGWPGLTDPGIVQTIQHKHRAAILARAWVTHDYIPSMPGAYRS